MAVKIKLKRMGKVRAPHYRIVVADARTKRDGRAIEEIGNYRPTEEPSLIEVDSERVQYWLKVGAQPTEPVRAILRKTGDWQLFKGEPAPAPLKRPTPKADKQAVFDAAAKEAMGEAGTGAATTPRGKGGRKPKAADKTEAGGEAAATDESAEA